MNSKSLIYTCFTKIYLSQRPAVEMRRRTYQHPPCAIGDQRPLELRLPSDGGNDLIPEQRRRRLLLLPPSAFSSVASKVCRRTLEVTPYLQLPLRANIKQMHLTVGCRRLKAAPSISNHVSSRQLIHTAGTRFRTFRHTAHCLHPLIPFWPVRYFRTTPIQYQDPKGWCQMHPSLRRD
jgi:hypothetical protein